MSDGGGEKNSPPRYRIALHERSGMSEKTAHDLTEALQIAAELRDGADCSSSECWLSLSGTDAEIGRWVGSAEGWKQPIKRYSE